MNKQQQEIKNFHEALKPVLEEVLANYPGKTAQKIYSTILKPCKRLLQKCSCKSVSDTSALCSLAYWLYIYDEKELALNICEAAHGAEFPFEFGVWNSGIQNIYGLEIRIARELLGEDRKGNIPPQLLEYCFSKRVQKELRYPQLLRADKIKNCSTAFLETELLLALYHMIGLGETGLFPELEHHREEIEEAISLYIDCLKTG